MRLVLLLSCLLAGAMSCVAQGDATPAPSVSATSSPCATPGASATPSASATPGAPATSVAVELFNGSRIIGAPDIDRIKIKTPYANLEVPWSLLRKVELSGTSGFARLNLQNGDLLSGQLSVMGIEMKTVFGRASIPMGEVHTIQVHSSLRVFPEGMVLHYTFDADEGDRVTDSSGAGNNGRVSGATYTNKGKLGGAMSFNGERQDIVVGNSASLRLQDFTIMAWIKRSDTSNVSRTNIDGEFFGYGYGGYMFGIHNSGRLFISKVRLGEVQSSCGIQDDVFHHVAVTKQGSKIVFYLDGTAWPGPDYNPGFEFNTDAAVGAVPDNLDGCFLGIIDEVAVFNRALSEDEVKQMYGDQK